MCIVIAVKTPIPRAFFVIVAICTFLFKFNIPSLKAIKLSDYIVTILFLLLSNLAKSQMYSISIIEMSLCGFYFVLCSVYNIRKFYEKKFSSDNIAKLDSKLDKYELITIVLSSSLVMTLFTTSSPLYKLNFWDDANCFFTLGRSIASGLVPYRDVYEQKGPYLYFLHAIAALVSDGTFIGVFVIEIIASILFMTALWKTIKLFYKPSHKALILIPFITAVTYSLQAFHFGDSAEELCFPILAWVAYWAIKSETKKQMPTNIETILIGVISGYLFFLKYTFCALVFAYLVFIVIASAARKTIKQLPKYIGLFLAGFVAAIIPIFVYFGINNAIGDMFEVYFYNNIFIYTGEAYTSVGDIISNLVRVIGKTMIVNENLCYILGLSIISAGCMKKNLKGLFALMFIVVAGAVYLPTTHVFYYCYIMMAMAPWAWVLIVSLFDEMCSRLGKIRWWICICPMAVIVFLTANLFMTQKNIYYIGMPDDEIPQIRFAKIINEVDNPKILTYNVMDSGFYNASMVLPSNRYYCYLNISEYMPELEESQLELIENGEFDFVITDEEITDWDNYDLVTSQDEYSFYPNNSGEMVKIITRTYYLYQRQ